MKLKHFLLVLLIFWVNIMFAQKILPEQDFTSVLRKSFPEATIFVHQEPDEETTKDTLSYEFHFPEVSIKSDTLHLSYVQKIKEYTGEISVELIQQTIPLRCVEEINTFNFTFGARDRFEPALTYLGFWMKEDNCQQTETFSLPQDRWQDYKQFKMTRISQESWYVARFPVMLTKKELQKIKKHLKTLQK